MSKLKLLAGFGLVVIGLSIFAFVLLFQSEMRGGNDYIFASTAIAACILFSSGLFITRRG